MIKNLSKIIAGSILAGVLTFLPVSGGVKNANAGEEITHSPYYDSIKHNNMLERGKYLEKLTIEKEKQSLAVQRHLLKKGSNIIEYFDRGTGKHAVFKGNEIKYIHTDSRGGGYAPRIMSEQERSKLIEELVSYLKELKQEGYKALSQFNSDLSGLAEKTRQIGVDELIEEIYKLEAILKARNQEK